MTFTKVKKPTDLLLEDASIKQIHTTMNSVNEDMSYLKNKLKEILTSKNVTDVGNDSLDTLIEKVNLLGDAI